MLRLLFVLRGLQQDWIPIHPSPFSMYSASGLSGTSTLPSSMSLNVSLRQSAVNAKDPVTIPTPDKSTAQDCLRSTGSPSTSTPGQAEHPERRPNFSPRHRH